MTHRKCALPKDPVYLPLQVGKALGENLGYLGDDTGDHISEKNIYYGELTGQYWVAKNDTDSDYLGLCHYRRFFLNGEGRILSRNE